MRPFQAPCSALSAPRRRPAKEPDRSGERTSRNESYAHCLLSRFVVGAVPIRWGRSPCALRPLNSPGTKRVPSSTKKSSESKQTSPLSPLQLARLPYEACSGQHSSRSTPAASKPAATQQTRPANSTGMSGSIRIPASIKARHALLRQDKQGKYMSEADPSRPAIALPGELAPLATLRFSQWKTQGNIR